MKFKIPTTKEWLDILKVELELRTDAELAARLHATKQAMSNWQIEKNQMDTKTAMLLGIALGINPLFVIGCTQYHCAKNDRQRETWKLLLRPLEPKSIQEVAARRLKKRRLND